MKARAKGSCYLHSFYQSLSHYFEHRIFSAYEYFFFEKKYHCIIFALIFFVTFWYSVHFQNDTLSNIPRKVSSMYHDFELKHHHLGKRFQQPARFFHLRAQRLQLSVWVYSRRAWTFLMECLVHCTDFGQWVPKAGAIIAQGWGFVESRLAMTRFFTQTMKPTPNDIEVGFIVYPKQL